MKPELVLRECRLIGASETPCDIVVRQGAVVHVGRHDGAADEVVEVGGRLVFGGFAETHVHLDKSRLTGRCAAARDLDEAVRIVAGAKRGFTEEDIYERGRATLEIAIMQGVNRMRAHVEVDPRIGLTGLAAMRWLKHDYAWAIDLQLCVFAQEGMTNDPGSEALLAEALQAGGDLIGGAPYMDSDPAAQLGLVFDLARRFDVDVDLHLDFDLRPETSLLDETCRLTEAAGWGGRVTIGHVTSLVLRSPGDLAAAAVRLSGAGVAVTALPATDLFLLGCIAPVAELARAGVACSLSTNNVLNPFTPFGDGSLLRLANLYANVAGLRDEARTADCFAMIAETAARILNAPSQAITAGAPATFVVLDCADPVQAVREIAVPLAGYRNGRRTFTRHAPALHPPARSALHG